MDELNSFVQPNGDPIKPKKIRNDTLQPEEAHDHWEILHSGQVVVSDTPESLWLNAIQYFKWCKEHPLLTRKTVMVGKGAGSKVQLEYVRPYTIKGLCLHCGIMEEYLNDIRQTKDKTSLYYNVVSKILYVIYTQNMEMAIIGEFNPVFTARVLNMDKDDTSTVQTVKVEIITSQELPTLSNTENEILEKLESEFEIRKITDIE